MSNVLELAEMLDKGLDLFKSSVADTSELLDLDVLSLTSSNLADSVLLTASSQERMRLRR